MDAEFNNISINGSITGENGLGGLAQKAGGYFKVDGFSVSSTAELSINGTDNVYSGLLFGDSSNAWTDVSGFSVSNDANYYC